MLFAAPRKKQQQSPKCLHIPELTCLALVPSLPRLRQGTLDSSILTEQGISQALEAGKALASAVDLDLGPAVVVSPMGRAQQTLECVREELRKGEASKDFETVEIVPDIREIELFEW